jgi:hypothetical protein
VRLAAGNGYPVPRLDAVYATHNSTCGGPVPLEAGLGGLAGQCGISPADLHALIGRSIPAQSALAGDKTSVEPGIDMALEVRTPAAHGVRVGSVISSLLAVWKDRR